MCGHRRSLTAPSIRAILGAGCRSALRPHQTGSSSEGSAPQEVHHLQVSHWTGGVHTLELGLAAMENCIKRGADR